MKRGPSLAIVALTPAWLLSFSTPRLPDASPRPGSELISSNDNRQPAGRLENGVLTLRLEARDGLWYPEGPDGLVRAVAAFAEQGGPLQNPGPLIRVSVGTEVRVTLRNALGEPLIVHGFGETRGIHADSVRIEPGGVREMRFTASTPGTFWYAGRTTPVPELFLRAGPDSQLNGVIVVDPPGAPRPARDRIFLISWWGAIDTTAVSGLVPGSTIVINGLSWPYTERLDVTQGDSLHWRWVSMTGAAHPMHLHGFYFRVDGRGNGAQYTVYPPDQQRLAVTEVLLAGETMTMAWSPTRPGNWLFHCHFARHMAPHSALEKDRRMPVTNHATDAGQHSDHAEHMAKLVLGIRVTPFGELAPPSREPRPMRLLIRSKANVYGEYVGYGYVLGGSPEEENPAALSIPGPTLLLEKDQPVAITIVNQSHEPAAVHWHGIELESFPDGVPGWSGAGKNLLPVIPPSDSLTVRFTPPRAGTFMYHSHFNEHQQISSGLYGAILVLDPGQRHDPDIDRVLLFSDGGPTLDETQGPFAPILLNGRTQPDPMVLRAGVTYRFRLINIRSDFRVETALLQGDRPVEWRAVAKDGADLPAAQATIRPAHLTFGAGEIYDFEFTPRAPGELRLTFGFPPGPRPNPSLPAPTVVPVQVR